MNLLVISHLRRTRCSFGMLIFALSCAFRLEPVGHGQTVQASQEPEAVSNPIPRSDTKDQVAAQAPSAVNATVYVYRPGQGFGAGWHASIYVNSNHFAELHLRNYTEVQVPQGKVYVAGITPNNPFFPLPFPLGRLASLSGCAALDMQLEFVSGAPAASRLPETVKCEEASRGAMAMIEASLASSGPSEEAIQLCGLQVIQGGFSSGGGSYTTWSTGYRRSDLQYCQLRIGKVLSVLTGTYPAPAPFRLAFNAEAGQTYYVKYSYTIPGGKLELVNSATGAKNVHKLHLAKNQ